MYNCFQEMFSYLLYGDDDEEMEVDGLFDLLYHSAFPALIRLNALYGVSLVKNGVVEYEGEKEFKFNEPPYKPFDDLSTFMYDDVRMQLFNGVAKAHGWEMFFETEDIESAIKASSLLLFLDGAMHNNFISRDIVSTALSELNGLGIDFESLAEQAAVNLSSIWDVDLPMEVIREILYDNELLSLDKVTIYKNVSEELLSGQLDDGSILTDSNIFDCAFEMEFSKVVRTDDAFYMILKSYDYGDQSGCASIGIEHFGNTELLLEF